MNTRRQTVWLVSMLGLMVVLSAYYLFTDEAEQIPVQSGQTAESEIIVEGVGMMDPTQGVSIDDLAPADGGGAAGGKEPAESGDSIAGEDPDASTSGTPDEAEETATNERVLEQWTNRSGADAITAMQIERNSDFSRRIEQLTAAIADEAATEEQIAEAVNRHSALLDLESKLIAFEEKLLSDYENAAVTYDEAKQHYTVHVSAAELEKSEAVSIVTEAMNDLSVALHQITVKLHR